MAEESEVIIDPEVEAAVIKRGETCVITTLSRTALGLQLRVKAHRAVELFMQGLASPELPPVEVSLADRYWVTLAGKPPLMAYRIATPLPSVTNPITGGSLFTLDRLSRPLLDNDPDSPGSGRERDMPVNLSYLRLIGISDSQGVCFNVRGVYSLDALRMLQERIAYAQQQFYINYIRPINLSVIVSTQEVQL